MLEQSDKLLRFDASIAGCRILTDPPLLLRIHATEGLPGGVVLVFYTEAVPGKPGNAQP
jgi:hypothetical protein